MLKPMISFIISALILFLSLTGFVYHQQSVGNYDIIPGHSHSQQKPNLQAILSDIFGPDVIEQPSTVKKLTLLDILLLIIALTSAVFMSIFAYVLASSWLRGNKTKQ